MWFALGLPWGLGAFPALAHHDTAVQQFGAGSPSTAPSTLLDAPSPRFEARARFDWSSFGELREGRTRRSDAEPSIAVERYTLSAGVRLASRTRFDLALPTGRIRGGEPGRFGLGDVAASLTQELGILRLGVLGSVPTGRYTVDAVSSIVDVQPDDTGELSIITYDARASLGSGTFRTGLTAGLLVQTGRVVGTLQSTWVQPLGETSDDIRWGSDLALRGVLAVRAFAERLSLGAGLLGQLHTADRVNGEPAANGAATTLRTSRRRSLAVTGTLGARLASGFSCGTQVRVPVVQWVQGVQLAESFTVSAQCTVARGFGRREPE